MIRRSILHLRALGLAALLATSAGGASPTANQLAGHPSPYLALHANDPVNWQSWQADVFRRASEDNRLVLVSIGYFSCHWCHIMQRESYQDMAIARVLNERYIAVKVDRELDPDLDQRMIRFVERIRGAAGWPLNVLLTPEGYPLTGFTYLPRDSFLRIMQQLDLEWQQNHASIRVAAEKFFRRQAQEETSLPIEAPDIPPARLVDAFVAQSMLAADELQGGFGNGSKFPNVPQLETLLQIVAADPALDPDVAAFLRLTLDAMVANNLSDHVNGGFFRYTTDPDWQTPHFEKMLYDNAQLAGLYLRAHRIWPESGYAGVALRTLDFVEAALKHPQGGYMSSLSAVDVNSVEGGAYLWDGEQLEALLPADDIAHLKQAWRLESFPDQFLLRPLTTSGDDATRNRAILQRLRARKHPAMPADDKRLASWNALMLDALTLAAQHDDRFARRAHALYRFMREHFHDDSSLIRLAGDSAAADAVFEDHAQLAHAYYRFGKHFNQAAAVALAATLVEDAQRRYLIAGRWRQKVESLIPVAPGEWVIPDQVLVSPMTLWLEAALSIPGVAPNVSAAARQMLQRVTRDMIDTPYSYASFIRLRQSHPG